VTPAHDHNDYQTGLRHSLEMISIFDESAKTNEKAGKYAGLDRFEARKQVVADLEEQGLLVKIEPHKLSLAVSQRSNEPVEPRLCPQWFVRVGPMAEAAIAAVEQGKTKFVPAAWTQTFYNWMKNIHDWCVSRQLWWGHQIPAWYNEETSPKTKDGKIDFFTAEPVVSRNNPGVTRDNPSGKWVQDPDVLDTWFSSGLWPFSTLGWPAQTPELKAFYPNSVMETGHDIIFFWVARMMMFGLHFMKDVPFRTVYLHAMVRDEKGEKMSKTKGNVIDPLDIIQGAPAAQLPGSIRNKFPQGMPPMGADALRFTLASLTQQGRDIRLSVDRIGGYKAFCNKIWNASRFALMNMGDFTLSPSKFIKDEKLSLADRWILSRLNKVIAQTQASLAGYQFAEAASALYQFLWGELCDWYIELSKPALYGDDAEAKRAAQAVLVFSLDRVLRLLHPFMPFITEEIWQKLPMERPTASICVAPYPEADRRLDDEAAEAEMKPVIEAIEGIRTIRGESNLSPALKLTAHVQSSEARVRDTLIKWKSYLMPLAGLSRLEVEEPGIKPPQSAADIRTEMEIYVPLAGIVDLVEERARLTKEQQKAEKELEALKNKLSNKSFVERAPAEVVAKDKARVGELEVRIGKLGENVRRIAPVSVKVAPPADAGAVDIGRDLQRELSEVKVPTPDQQVKESLDMLREGTKEGLSARDRYDLGVAYMGMGLVDDAVREFTKAKEGDPSLSTEDTDPRGKALRLKPEPTVKSKVKAPPAKKKAAPAAKAKPAPNKKAAAKKPAPKKPTKPKGGPLKKPTRPKKKR
jgi:valyl-tRNA synthetase